MKAITMSLVLGVLLSSIAAVAGAETAYVVTLKNGTNNNLTNVKVLYANSAGVQQPIRLNQFGGSAQVSGRITKGSSSLKD